MAEIDYDALASQFGGADAKGGAPVDYDALAARFGSTPSQTGLQRADAALQKAATGVVEGGVNFLTGAVAAPVAGLAGLAQGAKNLVVPGGMSAADRVAQVAGDLTYEPKTNEGLFVQDVATAIPEKIAHWADVAGDAVARVTGSPALGATVNTGIQAIPAVAMKTLKPTANRAAALARERAEIEAKLPEARAILTAKERGLSIAPAEANPTLLNRILQGFGGQHQTQLSVSAKNQPVIQQIVRKSLGMGDDMPVTRESLEAVRKEAGKTYEKVRNVGDISMDEQYMKALDKIEEDYKGVARDFPEEADAVQKAVESARKTSRAGVFDADSAVSKIKIERKRADQAFRTGDAELGKTHKAIAEAIEQQIERGLQETGTSAVGGKSDLLAEFRKSREIIARSYDVQKALKGGDVDARVLAKQLEKGRPLGDDLTALASVADKFKGSFQAGGKNAPMSSQALDTIMAAGELATGPAGLSTAAKALALFSGRPALRASLASDAGQRYLVKPPAPRMSPTMAQILASDPAAAATIGLQGMTLEEALRDQ